jgi:glutamate-5-semialdehyde dehydrogenase
MQELFLAAKAAKPIVGQLSTAQKNSALLSMADALEECEADILAANQLDLTAARGRISEVMLDRLRLTSERIAAMA